MKSKKTFLGALAIITAAMLWAFDGVFLLPEIRHLDVNMIVFIQHIIPFLLMTIVFIPFCKTIQKDAKSLNTIDWIIFLLIGFFGGYLGTYAITQAFFHVFAEGASITSVFLMQKLQPIFVILLSLVLLKERPSKAFWILSSLALLGVYLLTFGVSNPEFSFKDQSFVASLFAILAAFSWGSSTVFSKKVLKKVSFITSTYFRFAITSVIAGITTFATYQSGLFESVTAHQWKIFLIISLTTGGFAIWLYYWGLKEVKASKSAIYELAMPVSAIFFEFCLAPIVFDNYSPHNLTLWQWLGGIILLISIILVSLEKQKQLKDK